MSDEAQQEGQKTVVSFVAGLLIGGLLVWIFSGTPETEVPTEVPVDDTASETTDTSENSDDTTSTTDDDSTAPAPAVEGETVSMEVGEGSANVTNQPAGLSVALNGATFPTEEGWIAVRTYQNDQLGSILGAARYSQEQGLIPESIPLLASTVPGGQYAVVFFSEDGNREFNLDGDVQLDTELSVFTAE
jgi:hypothetical protein